MNEEKTGTLASASGKMFLFGEHSVLYGHPAIVVPVPCGVSVESSFHSRKGATRVLPKKSVHASSAVKAFLEWNRISECDSGITLHTASDIPFPGLGSSSATIVATIRSLSRLFGKKLSDNDVYSIAKKAKKIAEGSDVSFADVACSTFGCAILYNGAGMVKRLVPKNSKDISFIAASTPRERTTAELVRRVKSRSEAARGLMPLIDCMGRTALNAASCVRKGDWRETGLLMADYHALLSFIGVNTPALSGVVARATSAGALGAKTSGAGGGDCAIILSEKGRDENRIVKKLNMAGIRTLKFGLVVEREAWL